MGTAPHRQRERNGHLLSLREEMVLGLPPSLKMRGQPREQSSDLEISW